MSNNELSTLTRKEKNALYRRKWRKENRELDLERKREYREKNRDTLRKKQREYSKTPDGKIANASSRRAEYSGDAHSKLTAKYCKELLAGQKSRCNNCGCKILHKLGNINLDHFIPITKGGLNTLDNVQWLCYTCNMAKFNWLPTFPLAFILWDLI